MVALKYQMECGGEARRLIDHPTLEYWQGAPPPILNLFRVKLQDLVGRSAIELNKLLLGSEAGADVADALYRYIAQTEFFFKFASGTCVVVLSEIDVARGGGVPQAGRVVLACRALLHEDFAAAVQHNNVHGTVK